MTIFVNDREIKFGLYPNGEAIVPNLPQSRSNRVDVRLHWTGDEDLLRLALVRGLLTQNPHFVYFALTVDYMPYSRMDREQNGNCFSLKYVADAVNAMAWDKVYIVEPHSQATLDLLQKSEPIWATARLTPAAMEWMNFDRTWDFLVLPDEGAYKRYAVQIPELAKCNVIVLKKKRDFETGRIQGLEIDHVRLRNTLGIPPRPKGLILDDLCSRGGTFASAALLLRESLGFSSVCLLVTHMENAGVQGDLRNSLNRVFCTDTMTFDRPVPDNFEIFQRSLWS